MTSNATLLYSQVSALPSLENLLLAVDRSLYRDLQMDRWGETLEHLVLYHTLGLKAQGSMQKRRQKDCMSRSGGKQYLLDKQG